MAEQETFKVFVGNEVIAREIIINSKDTGFQITNSLSSQFGIFGKKVTTMIQLLNESIIFDPERELESYSDIVSLQLVLEDFEDDRGGKILSSSSKFNPEKYHKLLVDHQFFLL